MIYPKVQSVIDVLRQVAPEKFDMQDTKRCIAGHCKNLGFNSRLCCDSIFVAVAGTPMYIAREAVYPDALNSTMIGCDATLPQAIKMLEHLRDYGIVDWARALGKVHA